MCTSSVGFPLNTGGSLGRHCTFMVSVVGNPERKIGCNGGFLAVGFLDVAVFHTSPKLGSSVLVSGNWETCQEQVAHSNSHVDLSLLAEFQMALQEYAPSLIPFLGWSVVGV